MSDFHVVEAETILSSYVFSVDRRVVSGPSGDFVRDVVIHAGAVAVVAVDSEGRVALLSQYRASLDRINLEIPAGTCDIAGEDVLATAKRELLEEIGARSERWSKIAHFYNSPGWTNQETVVFLAEDCVIGEARPEGPEENFMTVKWLHADQIRDLISNNSPFDGTASIGLYAWLATKQL